MRNIGSIAKEMKQDLSGTETIIEFGTFCVTSGGLVLSDPCYGLDVWCLKKVDGVKNGACCDLTLSDKHGGVLSGGGVVSSGYGDGCYDGCLYLQEGEIVGACVRFIEEQSESE